MDPFFGKGVDKLIEGTTEGPIKTINMTWDLIFGGYHNWISKVQFNREQDLENYKNSIQNKLQAIPPHNLEEPKLSILGPALEASKFYISDEILRDMFAKLISSSMDNRKSNFTHQSFVEIIKQMSPDDALLLKYLCTIDVIPTVRFSFSYNQSGTSYLSNALINNSPLGFKETEVSLANLKRIGIIETNIGLNSYTNESLYNPFSLSTFTDEMLIRFKSKHGKVYDEVFSILKFHPVDIVARDNKVPIEHVYSMVKPVCIDFEKGITEITPFGNNFIQSCVL